MKRYFKPKHFQLIEGAHSFKDLAKAGLEILAHIKETQKPADGIALLSGPMSTGGTCNFARNMEIFCASITAADFFFRFTEKHKPNALIFDQMPLQSAITRLMNHRPEKADGYDRRILDDLYLPLFESGHITTLITLPQWQTSRGASWEVAQATRLGMNIIPLCHMRQSTAAQLLKTHRCSKALGRGCECKMCQEGFDLNFEIAALA